MGLQHIQISCGRPALQSNHNHILTIVYRNQQPFPNILSHHDKCYQNELKISLLCSVAAGRPHPESNWRNLLRSTLFFFVDLFLDVNRMILFFKCLLSLILSVRNTAILFPSSTRSPLSSTQMPAGPLSPAVCCAIMWDC